MDDVFDVYEIPHLLAVAKLRSVVFSMLAEASYLKDTRSRIMQNVFVDAQLASYLRDRGEAYVLRCLDVAALHALVLDDLLGIDEAKLAAKTNVYYIKDVQDALAREADTQAVFLMRAVTVEAVRACAEAGERMPQKSTYFYPKLASGVTLRSLG